MPDAPNPKARPRLARPRLARPSRLWWLAFFQPYRDACAARAYDIIADNAPPPPSALVFPNSVYVMPDEDDLPSSLTTRTGTPALRPIAGAFVAVPPKPS